MIFRRLYHDGLAQASYLIACERTRAALVVDPLRDPTPYLEAAAFEDVRLAFVAETHIHADFLSGAEVLAQTAGAELLLSAERADAQATARIRRTAATELYDGTSITMGDVRLDVRHTPGHTPEHVSILVSDLANGGIPVGLLTGDFLFVGDVGRPDLLERAVGVPDSMRDAARDLYRSLQAIRSLPEFLQLWPGHGAGSACGRSLGAVPQSTLGYELRTNWAFQIHDDAAFVDEVLRDQPDPPAYFARMKAANAGAVALIPQRKRMGDDELREAVRAGALLVDTRPATEYMSAHAASSLSIPRGRSFLHWAGAILDPTRDVVLLTEQAQRAAANSAIHDLALIGFDRVLGAISTTDLASLATDGEESVARVAASEVPLRGGGTIVDVRTEREWRDGHIPGALHVPLTQLPARLDELRGVGKILVHCQGGARSTIAASVLRAAGITDVANVDGGYPAWLREHAESPV